MADNATVLTWPEFKEARPDLASVGEQFFYHYGVGLGFLATVRPDGGPRVHPISPVLFDGSLYGLIVPGPKLQDLRRDSRYALHSETFPPPRHDDAFYITGTVRKPSDGRLREQVGKQMLVERSMSEPWPGFERQTLLEFLVGTCLLTLTSAQQGLPADHTIWRP